VSYILLFISYADSQTLISLSYDGFMSLHFKEVWRWREKTHESSPSTSGKTHKRPSVIQTRNEEVSRPIMIFTIAGANIKKW